MFVVFIPVLLTFVRKSPIIVKLLTSTYRDSSDKFSKVEKPGNISRSQHPLGRHVTWQRSICCDCHLLLVWENLWVKIRHKILHVVQFDSVFDCSTNFLALAWLKLGSCRNFKICTSLVSTNSCCEFGIYQIAACHCQHFGLSCVTRLMSEGKGLPCTGLTNAFAISPQHGKLLQHLEFGIGSWFGFPKCRSGKALLENCRLRFCDELFAIEQHPGVEPEKRENLQESPVKRKLGFKSTSSC